jgi:hypothetical protein
MYAEIWQMPHFLADDKTFGTLKISGRFVIFLAHSRYLGDTFNLPYCTL